MAHFTAGIPLAPVITDIKLVETGSAGVNKSYNLTIFWEANEEELRPIHTFTGTVSLQQLVSSSDDGGAGPYSFSVDSNTTSYSVGDVAVAREYTVRVCSQNDHGINCSDPTSYLPFTLEPDEVEREKEGLPAGVIVSIVLLVVIVLVSCCLCCLCLCLCCFCPSLWRSYHPSRTGQPILCSLSRMYVTLSPSLVSLFFFFRKEIRG